MDCPPRLLEKLPPQKRAGLLGVLAGDPRPGYQEDPDRVYGMAFGGFEVRFRVREKILTVIDILTQEDVLNSERRDLHHE